MNSGAATQHKRQWQRRLGAARLAIALGPLVAAQDIQVHAQTTAFDVASIKKNDSGDQRRLMMPPQGGRFSVVNVTVRQLIQRAYAIQESLEGAPPWINSEGFDINASAPSEISSAILPTMLQGLLKDRFKLAAHTETRDGPTFLLTLARRDGRLGPHMKPSAADCPAPGAAAPAEPVWSSQDLVDSNRGGDADVHEAERGTSPLDIRVH